MKSTHLTRLASLMLSAGLISFSAQADTTLYEISKGKQKLFLGGTVHFLRAEDLPPPAEFDLAYEQASTLIFETDLAGVQTPAFGQKFAQAMILPNNQTLRDLLDANTWAALQNYSQKNNYPLSQTMMFNPAFTSVLMTVTALQKIPVVPGVDAHYYQKASAAHKTLGELETSDAAIESMKRFNQEDANKIISNTLADIDNINSTFADMVKAWRTGDLVKLDQQLGDNMRKNLPAAYQAMVVERNNAWLPKIEAMLKTPEVEMILVGSLHLSGNDGLLNLLKKDGYKIKAVQAPKS